MKITTNQNHKLVLEEIYSNTVLRTREGNEVALCMRDDTIEFNVLPKSGGHQWYRINMQTFGIEKHDD